MIVAFRLIIILGFFASVKNCICYQNTILNKHQATKTNKAKQPKNKPAQKFSGSRGKKYPEKADLSFYYFILTKNFLIDSFTYIYSKIEVHCSLYVSHLYMNSLA